MLLLPSKKTRFIMLQSENEHCDMLLTVDGIMISSIGYAFRKSIRLVSGSLNSIPSWNLKFDSEVKLKDNSFGQLLKAFPVKFSKQSFCRITIY